MKMNCDWLASSHNRKGHYFGLFPLPFQCRRLTVTKWTVTVVSKGSTEMFQWLSEASVTIIQGIEEAHRPSEGEPHPTHVAHSP
jgi:hypothetical protein